MHCECDGVMVYWTRRIAAMSTAVYIEAVRNAVARDAAARDDAMRRRSTGVLFSGLFVLKFSGVCINDEKRCGLCVFVNTQNIDYG